MKRALVVLLVALSLTAQEKTDNRANLTIAAEPLGDSDQAVVARITFRFTIPDDVPPEIPLAVVGSVLRDGAVVKNFRYLLQPEQRTSLSAIQSLPEGNIDIEARLMIPLEESAPVIVGKTAKTFAIARMNKPYVAEENDGAEGILAEGVVPESMGAVRILPPRRDLAPNMFLIDVDTKPPVQRVEFWVEGRKIFTRNSPPYRAELDLGRLPKRVEVKAIGYDSKGNYVDADAFIVNERETPLEVKITRTVTPDGVSHIKLSIQNPKNTDIRKVVLFGGQKKLFEWTRPPYAIDIPGARLAGIEFLRASVTDDTNYEASDLLFLSGDRYTEHIDVNLVELPVSVANSAGVPISDLKEADFRVLENGKPQKVSSFNYAANLPISVGLLIDHSGSMKPRMQAAKDAALAFLKSIMKPSDRAFVGGFAFDAKKLAPFASDVAALELQVADVPEAAGGTSLYDAIVTGLYRFRSVQGRKALIILSDGEDTTSRLSYDDMLTYVRASRVPLYFIGIGLGFADIGGTSKMKSLAAETGGVAYFVKDVKALGDTYAQLEKDLRTQYLLGYYAESTKNDQAYRTVEVKVGRDDAKVRTIRGYIP